MRVPSRATRRDQGFSTTGLACALAVGITIASTSLTGVQLARDIERADATAARVIQTIERTEAVLGRPIAPRQIAVADAHTVVIGGEHSTQAVSVADGFEFLSAVPLPAPGRLDVAAHRDRSSRTVYLLKADSPLSARAIVVIEGEVPAVYRWSGADWKR